MSRRIVAYVCQIFYILYDLTPNDFDAIRFPVHAVAFLCRRLDPLFNCTNLWIIG